MTNAERARKAQTAFEVSGYQGNEDVVVALYDFVCDLLHFADLHAGDPAEGVVPNTETNGEYVARMGLWHYLEELAEAAEEGDALLGELISPLHRDDPAECEGHPAGPFDPMGQTVYCDGSCRKGVAASQS